MFQGMLQAAVGVFALGYFERVELWQIGHQVVDGINDERATWSGAPSSECTQAKIVEVVLGNGGVWRKLNQLGSGQVTMHVLLPDTLGAKTGIAGGSQEGWDSETSLDVRYVSGENPAD